MKRNASEKRDWKCGDNEGEQKPLARNLKGSEETESESEKSF